MKMKCYFFLRFFKITVFVLLPIWSCGCSNSPEPRQDDLEGQVTDIDGNVYRTIRIGEQVWMAENLKVTKFRNGELIPAIADEKEWSGLTTPAFCNYQNDSALGVKFGRLYNWYAIQDKRNIAPEGWHIPTPEELRKLLNFLGGDTLAGGKMKEAGTEHWIYPNSGATNESGFTALPGGYRYKSGSYHTMGSNAYWWSMGNSYEVFSWHANLYDRFADLERDFGYANYGFSVRCVKD